jgi:nicotinate-nucleotide adenylyltransferase
MKIGVFGGAFNPPHLGHTVGARAAAEQLGLDLLIVVPSGVPPHKTMPEGSPAPTQRVAMTQIAFQSVPGAVVSDIEVNRPGDSFTADTLREITESYPGAELWLICGTDMYITLDKWYEAEFILRSASLAVTTRDGGAELCGYAEKYRKMGAVTREIRHGVVDISSSRLREALPARGGTEYLDEEVYSYIIRGALYGAAPDFDWLRCECCKMLKDSRVKHVAGCEAEAARLARRYGASEDDARAAAIMHDITKRRTLEEQLELAEKYGVETDDAERGSEKLLHAKTAAAIAKYEYHFNKQVCGAILWHTTGKPDMSLLEKVIYMADYIETNRKFDGLDALRALAYEDIDKALILGMEMSAADMEGRGIVPHPVTRSALEFLKNQKDEERKGL